MVRTSFVLVCLAPAAVVAALALWRHLPGHVEREARRLGASLGLKASLCEIRYLRPGVTLYEGLELADPETGRTLLRCRLLEVDARGGASGEGTQATLAFSQPEIDPAALDEVGRLLEQTLAGRAAAGPLQVAFSAADLSVKGQADGVTLVGLRGRIDTRSEAASAELEFRPADDPQGTPAKIRIVRNRQVAPPATGFELDTGGRPLPCAVLADRFRPFGQLGPRAAYCGTVRWVQSPQGASGELCGTLSGADLDRLVSDHFPHKLSGTAELKIDHARWEAGRLQGLQGTLAAGPGVVGRSLLAAAAAHLGLNAPQPPGDDQELIPYRQLVMEFVLDDRGLQLRGACPGGAQAIVLTDQEGRALLAGTTQVLRPAALVRMLVPLSEVQVPATPQTDWLIRGLPLPEIIAPANAQADPRGHLRLRGPIR